MGSLRDWTDVDEFDARLDEALAEQCSVAAEARALLPADFLPVLDRIVETGR